MTNASDGVDLTALDMALLPMFFISYSVIALVQITNLYGGRYGLFAGVTAGALALSLGFSVVDVSRFCDASASAIVCGGSGEGGDGLSAFSIAWVYSSLAMLVMFLFAQGLKRIAGPDRER